MPNRSLTDLWLLWETALASAPRMGMVARPPLLPHLRAVDEVQVDDTVRTMALEGITVSRDQVLLALANSTAAKVAHAGWPAPLPQPGVAVAMPDEPVLGYARALARSRLAVLDMLQGADPITILAADYGAWREAVCAGRATAHLARAEELAVMWDLAAATSTWDLRGALLHLAVWRLEEGCPGCGALARLLMNTVRAAAGHPWLRIPHGRDDEYRAAVDSALLDADARPWGQLLSSA